MNNQNQNISLTINKAAVTAVHEFNSFKGYGVDFFIEAQGSNSIVYFQVVVYDSIAHSYYSLIHEGDTVRVKGEMNSKVYKKKDGSDGTSFYIERPELFEKTTGSVSNPQILQNFADESQTTPIVNDNQKMDPAPATAVTADNEGQLDSNDSEETLSEHDRSIIRKYRDKLPSDATELKFQIYGGRQVITFRQNGHFCIYYIDFDSIHKQPKENPF